VTPPVNKTATADEWLKTPDNWLLKMMIL